MRTVLTNDRNKFEISGWELKEVLQKLNRAQHCMKTNIILLFKHKDKIIRSIVFKLKEVWLDARLDIFYKI